MWCCFFRIHVCLTQCMVRVSVMPRAGSSCRNKPHMPRVTATAVLQRGLCAICTCRAQSAARAYEMPRVSSRRRYKPYMHRMTATSIMRRGFCGIRACRAQSAVRGFVMLRACPYNAARRRRSLLQFAYAPRDRNHGYAARPLPNTCMPRRARPRDAARGHPTP